MTGAMPPRSTLPHTTALPWWQITRQPSTRLETAPSTGAGHGVFPQRRARDADHDHGNGVVVSHGIPEELDVASVTARAVGAGDPSAAVDHAQFVGLLEHVVLDVDEARLVAEEVVVARHALAARLARPVAG